MQKSVYSNKEISRLASLLKNPDLEKIKDLEFSIYPTDGWIVTNLKDKSSIKVKHSLFKNL